MDNVSPIGISRWLSHASRGVRRVLLAALLAAPAASASPCAGFQDVDSSSPFCSSVEWLKSRGITVGCGNGSYCPNDTPNRLQTAVLLERMAKKIGGLMMVDSTGKALGAVQYLEYAGGMAQIIHRGQAGITRLVAQYDPAIKNYAIAVSDSVTYVTPDCSGQPYASSYVLSSMGGKLRTATAHRNAEVWTYSINTDAAPALLPIPYVGGSAQAYVLAGTCFPLTVMDTEKFYPATAVENLSATFVQPFHLE